MSMNKSKYIGKYDYIGYYTEQKEMWFHSTAEVVAGIKSKVNIDNISYDDENEGNNFSDNEFDVLSYYREELENNKNVDKNDPRIIEGKIIDKKTKQFIINEFKNIKFVDLESKEYRGINMEDLYQITLDLINNYDEIILFQPVFIKGNMITKCDAIVKKDNIINLIETKATSSTKLHHYLDILYQKNVIEDHPYNKQYTFKYFLCIVKFEKQLKDNVSFEITPYFNISKSSPQLDSKKEIYYSSSENIIEAKSLLKTGRWFKQPNTNDIYPVSFDKILRSDFFELHERQKVSNRSRAIEKMDLFLELNNNFDNVINELFEHKIKIKKDNSIPINFKPSPNDNGDFKKSKFWVELKEIYKNEGYEIFKYSGNVANQKKEALELIQSTGKKKLVEEDILGTEGKTKEMYIDCYIKKKDIINRTNSKNLLNIKKNKSVYFDFETINTSIRSFDNTLPFSQIITQCSIIKSSKKDIKDWDCNNLVVDPRFITIEWFKNVVDSIYDGSNCSYVVYNKNFEKSRLKELKDYINDKSYSNKIDIINQNLYDLADFFIPSNNNIILEELYGFYSIKKVLALIEKEKPEIFTLCKCKDYKKLEIKNGSICQQETTKRFFNILTEDEWKKLEIDLKIYCENDVRAMIAVEMYIKELLERKRINQEG